MKKILFFILILFTAMAVSACGTSYMGKQVKKDMTRRIQTPTGKNHRYTLDHLVVDYDYTAHPDQQLIVIKGTVDDRQQDAQAHFVQDAGWILKEAYLDIYFLDAERRVVASCREDFPPGHFAFPYPFEVKCPFRPEFQHAALSYLYRYVKYSRVGEVEKLYQHRLDIE